MIMIITLTDNSRLHRFYPVEAGANLKRIETNNRSTNGDTPLPEQLRRKIKIRGHLPTDVAETEHEEFI